MKYLVTDRDESDQEWGRMTVAGRIEAVCDACGTVRALGNEDSACVRCGAGLTWQRVEVVTFDAACLTASVGRPGLPPRKSVRLPDRFVGEGHDIQRAVLRCLLKRRDQ